MKKYQRQKSLTTLAMSIHGRIITAEKARLTAECSCFCLHCRCPLLLYGREPHLPAYFRHDPRTLTAKHTWSYALKLICQKYRKIHVPPWYGGSACCATDNTLETGAVPFAIRDCIASRRQKSLRKNHLMPLQPDLTGKRQLFFTSMLIVWGDINATYG